MICKCVCLYVGMHTVPTVARGGRFPGAGVIGGSLMWVGIELSAGTGHIL